jgi:hypothetical protein
VGSDSGMVFTAKESYSPAVAKAKPHPTEV